MGQDFRHERQVAILPYRGVSPPMVFITFGVLTDDCQKLICSLLDLLEKGKSNESECIYDPL